MAARGGLERHAREAADHEVVAPARACSLTSWRRAWAVPRACRRARSAGSSCQSSRDASQPMSRTPATADSGWWRTVTALIVRRSGRRCGRVERRRDALAPRRRAQPREVDDVDASRRARTPGRGRRACRARRRSRAARPGRARAAPRPPAWCPCGDHSSVGRSVTTSGSAIVSRSSRCWSPSVDDHRLAQQRELARPRVHVGGDRRAPRRVERAPRLEREHDRPCGVRAADVAQAVGDLAAPLLVDDAR